VGSSLNRLTKLYGHLILEFRPPSHLLGSQILTEQFPGVWWVSTLEMEENEEGKAGFQTPGDALLTGGPRPCLLPRLSVAP
jgi:hypothetical protein